MPDAIALDDVIKRFRIRPGTGVKLKHFDPAWAGDHSIAKVKRKQFARTVLSGTNS